MLRPVPIPDARRMAKATGATRLVILALDDRGTFAWTTYGETKAICTALGAWARENAETIAAGIQEATG